MSQKFTASAKGLGRTLKVECAMSRPVFTLSADDSLLVLLEAMDGKGVRHVPILGAQGEVSAVVNRMDVLAFAPSLTSGLSRAEKGRVLGRFKVRDLLQSREWESPLSLKPTQSLGSAAKRMLKERRDCAVVTDKRGTPVGILTESNFVSLFSGRAL